MLEKYRIVITFLVMSLLLVLGVARAENSYRPGYTEKGPASWYGDEEQGKPVASGGHFDKHQLTAAHRHLPFGTVVRVTNLRNKLSVDVTINDRGPFKPGRIIDVSEAAAKALKMRDIGIAQVEVKVLRLANRDRD